MTLELSPEQRKLAISFLAERFLDNMSLKDLECFFIETQEDYLADYTDQELVGTLEDYTTDDEFDSLLSPV
jgi:hypothetical protein